MSQDATRTDDAQSVRAHAVRYPRGVPNFDAVVVAGTTPTIWEDTHAPHRSNVPHLYRRVVLPTAPAVATVTIHCHVGTAFLNDAGLGGNLFTAARVAWSGSFPFPITQGVGFSAAIALTFTADMAGHQELCIRRPGGGAILLSFEVE